MKFSSLIVLITIAQAKRDKKKQASHRGQIELKDSFLDDFQERMGSTTTQAPTTTTPLNAFNALDTSFNFIEDFVVEHLVGTKKFGRAVKNV